MIAGGDNQGAQRAWTQLWQAWCFEHPEGARVRHAPTGYVGTVTANRYQNVRIRYDWWIIPIVEVTWDHLLDDPVTPIRMADPCELERA